MHKVRKFVAYYKNHWKLFVLDMFCAFLMAGLDLLFPAVTRIFMKDFIPNRQLRSMVIFLGVFVVLYVVRLIAQYIVEYWGHVVGVRME